MQDAVVLSAGVAPATASPEGAKPAGPAGEGFDQMVEAALHSRQVKQLEPGDESRPALLAALAAMLAPLPQPAFDPTLMLSPAKGEAGLEGLMPQSMAIDMNMALVHLPDEALDATPILTAGSEQPKGDVKGSFVTAGLAESLLAMNVEAEAEAGVTNSKPSTIPISEMQAVENMPKAASSASERIPAAQVARADTQEILKNLQPSTQKGSVELGSSLQEGVQTVLGESKAIGDQAFEKLEPATTEVKGMESNDLTAMTGLESSASRLQSLSNGEPARLAEAHTSDPAAQIRDGMEAMLRSGREKVRLQLHPEELGQIELQISSHGDGMRVSLTAETSATRALLERYVGDLRQSLAEAGVKVSSFNIGQGDAGSQSQNAGRWSEQRPQGFGRQSGKDISEAGQVETPAARWSERRSDGALDTWI